MVRVSETPYHFELKEIQFKLIFCFISINIGVMCAGQSVTNVCNICTCDQYQTYINCDSCNLNSVPKAIPATVETLDLSRNQITNIEKDAFKHLINLRTLYLSDNRITSFPEGAFKNLVNLEEILDIWINNNNDELSQIPKPKGKIVLLDVRPTEEYGVSHLKNSIRVDHTMENLGPFVNSFAEPESKEPLTVVCYCSVGYRSSLLGTKMLDFIDSEGITNINVFNLEGFLFKWGNEHRPMYNERNEERIFVHPFNSVWGKLLDSELRKEQI